VPDPVVGVATVEEEVGRECEHLRRAGRQWCLVVTEVILNWNLRHHVQK